MRRVAMLLVAALVGALSWIAPAPAGAVCFEGDICADRICGAIEQQARKAGVKLDLHCLT